MELRLNFAECDSRQLKASTPKIKGARVIRAQLIHISCFNSAKKKFVAFIHTKLPYIGSYAEVLDQVHIGQLLSIDAHHFHMKSTKMVHINLFYSQTMQTFFFVRNFF